MERETLTPKDEADWLRLRTQDITSTDVAALFGVSPYSTLFETWHRKKNSHVVEVPQNERMTWGSRLQSAIAKGIAEDNGWSVRPMPEYIRAPKLKMGASFDFAIESPCECRHDVEFHKWVGVVCGGKQESGEPCTCQRFVEADGGGILEIKNVDSLAFRDGWLVDDDGVEAPPHIELQVQHQLLVSGRAFAYIGALVGGNRVVLLRREPNAKVFDAIKSRVGSFWMTIAMGKEPVPDFSRDAAVIGRLYGFAEPNKVLDARGVVKIGLLMEKYKLAAMAAKQAEEQKDAAKAEILMTVGDAEKVLGDDFSLSLGVMPPAEVKAYTRKPYRMFKPSWKKFAIKEEATA